MKIYIMTDMEGISGIRCQEQVMSDSPLYAHGRRLLSADTNAAICGAFDGGATEVVVNDGHGGGPHFLLEEMDPRALYERPAGGLNYMPSLDESFAGLFIVGAHAMAGTLNAFLDHTQSSASWYNYYQNGRKTGEMGQCGAWAGHFGVPTLLVAGDKAACEEALAFFGEIETVAVKQATGRQQARCVHPARSQQQIREAARRAMSLVGKVQPYRVEVPLTIRLELYRSDMADGPAQRPGTRRLDARTIERTVPNALEMLSF